MSGNKSQGQNEASQMTQCQGEEQREIFKKESKMKAETKTKAKTKTERLEFSTGCADLELCSACKFILSVKEGTESCEQVSNRKLT